MVLVTGGAGLVGNELIRQLLERGKTVRAIFNNTPVTGISGNNFEQVKGDILDVVGLEEIFEGVDEVYHCAAVVAFDYASAKKIFKVNVEGTTNIVNAALNAGVRKLVHVSSIASLARHSGGTEMTDENVPWTEASGNSRYGHSKYLGELEVWRGIAEGLNAVIVNPSVVLGAGNWNSGSTAIFKSVYEEFPWYTEGVTGFVDVRDVAKAMIMLMDSEIVSQRYIISAENNTYKNVFAMIANAFNKKPASKKVTPFMASLVWRLEALKSKFTGRLPLVTRETAGNALSIQYFDNSKLLNHLPAFRYHSLSQTVADTCASLQQKLNNH